jgi:hypothetical protein
MADSKKLDWAGHDAPRSDDIDWGGQAFPTEGGDQSGLYPDPGMSLRDYFAGQALVGFVHAYIGDGWHSPNKYQIEILANNAYLASDAMIAARKAGG